MRQGFVGLNESYNLVLVSDAANKMLKREGKTTDQITSMLLDEVSELAAKEGATPAWATAIGRNEHSSLATTLRGRFQLVA
jgi:hypothetical protein